LFYTKGYFRSRNCRRELYAAIHTGKPIIVLHDETTTGIDEIHRECQSGFSLEECDLDIPLKSFVKKTILWLGSSTREFSVESVKMVFLCILEVLPFYIRNPSYLNEGLTVSTELGPVELTSFKTIIVSETNSGAHSVAERALECLEVSGKDNCRILDVASSSDLKRDLNGSSYFLLYLNEGTFVNDETSLIVKKAIDLEIEIILIHEQDSERGACPFDRFFEQTPQFLIDRPYSIYGDLAIPLYSQKEYEKVSLRKLLLRMGAIGSSKQFLSCNWKSRRTETKQNEEDEFDDEEDEFDDNISYTSRVD